MSRSFREIGTVLNRGKSATLLGYKKLSAAQILTAFWTMCRNWRAAPILEPVTSDGFGFEKNRVTTSAAPQSAKHERSPKRDNEARNEEIG